MNEHELTVQNRKQRCVCKDCGRQFVENPPNKRIPQQLLGYGRQVAFGEDPNRWNFKSDRDFRTLAATVYQSEA